MSGNHNQDFFILFFYWKNLSVTEGEEGELGIESGKPGNVRTRKRKWGRIYKKRGGHVQGQERARARTELIPLKGGPQDSRGSRSPSTAGSVWLGQWACMGVPSLNCLWKVRCPWDSPEGAPWDSQTAGIRVGASKSTLRQP